MKFMLLLTFLMVGAFAQKSLPRASENNLTMAFAKERKSQVKSIKYKLAFEFAKKSKSYKGVAEILIELARTDIPLSIDFTGKKISSLAVNGVRLKSFPQRKGSFDIPAKLLTRELRIEVVYENNFSSESSGVQRVVDPEDGAEYISTDFEPYFAHTFFPCLDQPDLKATYQVSVLAPRDWKVIHNELIDSEVQEGDKRRTRFKETKLFSTYLFFLGAGPFAVWKDSYKGLPLAIFARKSLQQFVDAGRIFQTTKKGLAFFNDYFGYTYPFTKYDQIFIPEFAWGGMENPGAVTLNERNIFRGPVPEFRFDKRNGLILHEMAHMWFGDLVTMEWWNDLWLNESFASYLANIAEDRALGSSNTWTDFFQSKTWGYWQDQLPTTHPIETDVVDVRTARGNFDGITYAKGASALKQLHFFVGEAGFKKGLQDYFKRYAFQNTKREDFINAIGVASGKDLSQWTASWLKTSGPNAMEHKLECRDGKLTGLRVIQTPNVSGARLPHRSKFAFYDVEGESFIHLKTIDVTIDSDQAVVEGVSGLACPDFVLPNTEDQDYALYALDPISLNHANKALLHLPDPLSKLMVWQIMYQMVRTSQLKVMDFLEAATYAIAREQDVHLLGSLLGRYSWIKQIYYLYLTPEERSSFAPKLEEVVLRRIEEAAPGSDEQMNFFDFLVAISRTEKTRSQLYEILSKNIPPKGMTLDQDRRWMIIKTLAAQNYPSAMALIDAEKLKDSSSIGRREALAARASIPQLAVKKKIWAEIQGRKGLSYSDVEAMAANFHSSNFPELTLPFLKDFFRKVRGLDWKNHDDDVEIYLEELFPVGLCSDSALKLSQQQFKEAKRLSHLARRAWLESEDELRRCVEVRAYSKKKR